MQLVSVLKDMPLISSIINVNSFVEMVCSLNNNAMTVIQKMETAVPLYVRSRLHSGVLITKPSCLHQIAYLAVV